MKLLYTRKRFGSAALGAIEDANAIIEEYQVEGFQLTLRQLFYQHVARGLIENTERSYKRLGDLVSDARMAGLIDWDAIVDRTRHLRKSPSWADPLEIVSSCADQFAIDKWEPQQFYVECWVEKDALIGVIESICEPLAVPHFSCRGYTSQSEMWVASQRLLKKLLDGKNVLVLHLGDHDPSGVDMSRDIASRIGHFIAADLVRDWMQKHPGELNNRKRTILGEDCAVIHDRLEVRRIALTMKQVKAYNPPPNPAKITDSRAAGYIEQYGDKSWELDAIDPRAMADLVTKHVVGVRDEKSWKASVDEENRGRRILSHVVKNWEKITKNA